MLQRHKAVLQSQDSPELKQLQQAFAAVLDTDPGKLLFAHFFYRSGYNRAEVPNEAIGRVDQAAVDAAAKVNSARRGFYVELRALVPASHRKTLMEVELLAEDGWGSGLPKPKAEEPEKK